MVKTMDATHNPPLHSGKQTLLLHFLSLDQTLNSHPQLAKGTHGLSVAVGGSPASAVPRSLDSMLSVQHREALLTCKRRTRAPVLTGGPGAAPGGETSKNGYT